MCVRVNIYTIYIYIYIYIIQANIVVEKQNGLSK